MQSAYAVGASTGLVDQRHRVCLSILQVPDGFTELIDIGTCIRDVQGGLAHSHVNPFVDNVEMESARRHNRLSEKHQAMLHACLFVQWPGVGATTV